MKRAAMSTPTLGATVIRDEQERAGHDARVIAEKQSP
jgi:hypothetical protein